MTVNALSILLFGHIYICHKTLVQITNTSFRLTFEDNT